MVHAIITDVTRMLPPRVCIAAMHNSQTIRLGSPQPNEQILRSLGGLIPGDRVSVEWLTNPFSKRPHLEDGVWQPQSIRKLGRLTKSELVEVLLPGAARSVEEAFGPAWFRGNAGNGAFQPDHGERSLATLLVSDVRVYQWFEGVRVDFKDAYGTWTMVPLEDLSVRRHQKLCSDCLASSGRVSGFDLNLRKEFWDRDVVLRVGLTRPFTADGQATACWLQVTGVYPIGKKRRHFA